MTPEEQLHHIGLIRDLSKPGGVLDATGPYSTVKNPEWYQPNGLPTVKRVVMQERLKAEVISRATEVRQEGRALVLAGPPGAGKGRVADDVLGDDRAHYVNVDADEFKQLLLREAIADGSYETWIKPEAVRELEAQGERFYPLELASLVHEESSQLAAALRQDLIERRTNVIVDTVLGSEGTARTIGEQFAAAGYEVTVIDVEVNFEISEDRIEQRWQEAMREAEIGVADGLGGRWVPSTYARPLFETVHGRSKSQDVAEKLAASCPVVTRYERYYTSPQEHEASQREGRAARPVLEVAKVRERAGRPLEVKAVAADRTVNISDQDRRQGTRERLSDEITRRLRNNTVGGEGPTMKGPRR